MPKRTTGGTTRGNERSVQAGSSQVGAVAVDLAVDGVELRRRPASSLRASGSAIARQAVS